VPVGSVSLALLGGDPGGECDPIQPFDVVLHGPEADTMFAWSMAAGDLDDDGLADLAVGAPGLEDGGGVLAYRGAVTGYSDEPWFRHDGTKPDGEYGWDVAVADIDGDGIDDLLTLAEDGSVLDVRRGGSSGPGATPDASPVVGSSAFVVEAAGDVDSDGYEDVLVVSGEGTAVALWRGSTAGPMGEPALDLPGDAHVDAVIATDDLDSDGSRDVVVAARSDALLIFGGGGLDGTPPLSVAVPDGLIDDLGTGDFNADGRPDVVAGVEGSVLMYAGDGAGLAEPTTIVWSAGTPDFGAAIAGVGDVTGDGIDDVAIGDPSQGETTGSSLWLVSGGAPEPATTPTATWTPTDPSCGMAVVVSALGDANGDGRNDFAFADYTVDWRSGEEAGRVWVVHDPLADAEEPDPAGAPPASACAGCAVGTPLGAWWLILLAGAVACSRKECAAARAAPTVNGQVVVDLSAADTRYTGSEEEESLGWTVAHAGDIDGDCLDDVVFSAGFGERAFVVRGPADANLSEAATTWTGLYAGYTLDGGDDFDQDGLDDVVMGTRLDTYAPDDGWVVRVFAGDADGVLAVFDAPSVGLRHDAASDVVGSTRTYDVAWVNGTLAVGNPNTGSGPLRGTVWLLTDPPADGELDADASARLLGAEDYAHVGGDVRPAGDTDGDGVHEVMTHAAEGYESGAVFLVPTDVTGDVVLDDTANRITTDGVTMAGSALDGGADVTTDGLHDVLVGILHEDAYTNPIWSVALLEGPIVGERAVTTHLAVFEGQSVDDLSIEVARFAGDVDGDGFTDVICGAPGSLVSDPGGTAALFLGPHDGARSLADADILLLGEDAGAGAGHAVDRAGDVDGDGLDDLIVGSPDLDTTPDGGGAVYVELGSTLFP